MASAAEEELCESEVLWPEAALHDYSAGGATPSCSSSSPVAPRSSSRTAPAPRGVVVAESARPIHHLGSRPVDIPRPAARRRGHEDEDGGWSGSGTMVPPHVLVSRRRTEMEGAAAAAEAFALRSGPGRARELSHLRNNVLRMTGFIEG